MDGISRSSGAWKNFLIACTTNIAPSGASLSGSSTKNSEVSLEPARRSNLALPLSDQARRALLCCDFVNPVYSANPLSLPFVSNLQSLCPKKVQGGLSISVRSCLPHFLFMHFAVTQSPILLIAHSPTTANKSFLKSSVSTRCPPILKFPNKLRVLSPLSSRFPFAFPMPKKCAWGGPIH
jgi:hypothetical protein